MNDEIATRFREFGETHFDSVKSFAAALSMSPPALQTYLSGRSVPGTPVLLKLQKLGCDINWLLTGEIPVAWKAEMLEVEKRQLELKISIEELKSSQKEENLNILRKRLSEINTLIPAVKKLKVTTYPMEQNASGDQNLSDIQKATKLIKKGKKNE